MLAGGQMIDSLTVIVDFNKWQATGRSKEIMALDPLKNKWESFGCTFKKLMVTILNKYNLH